MNEPANYQGTTSTMSLASAQRVVPLLQSLSRADPETEKTSELLFWLDHRYPTYDNFWEWVVKFKKQELTT